MTLQSQAVPSQAAGSRTKSGERQTIYRVGAVAAALVVLTALSEIAITFLPGGSAAGESVSEWFALLQNNPFMGLRNLGLLNLIMTALGIPLMFVLTWAHRDQAPFFADLALICSLIGVAVFYATNRALPMLELSLRYAAAADVTQRSLLEAAAQAMLSTGQSHTPGTFLGFFFAELGGILMGAVMLRAGLFPRAAALAGVLGYSFLLIHEILASFAPAVHAAALIVAMIGGLANVAWYLLVAIRLSQLGQTRR